MKCYYDFHIHSALSPCSDNDMTPNNIVNMAYIKGLNAIAITDHNTTKNVRAAIKIGMELGITVIAGMEIETKEEVHILSLFPTIELAEKAEKIIRAHLPQIKNNETIFGEQRIIDENDNVIGKEEQMLITATSLSINDVFSLVHSCGGVAIPAHIDRHSYSILSNLGFIPDELNISTIEISKKTEDIEEYLKNLSFTQKYLVIRNSDAHYLGDISEKNNYIEVDNNSIQKILQKFI